MPSDRHRTSIMAPSTGFEPVTSAIGMQRSIQLSYEGELIVPIVDGPSKKNREKTMEGETMERPHVDAATLDRIDVRFRVHAYFEFGQRDFFVALADLSITCGLYSGMPDRECIADLIASRGIVGDDLDLTGATISKDEVAAMINERGIRGTDIRMMRIEEVLLDEQVIAQTVEN